MSANHENDLSPGRRYKKYEAAYNLAFAADPNQQQRHFDEMAPQDDIQWKRLEVFRGNDKDAYDAYKSNPNDALVKPTEKEEHMWQANQADHWRINREPAFGQHEMTNNKWLDLSLEQRRADSTQNYFNSVEQRHGAGYDGWAAKAGRDVVAKEDYLQTMASMDIEKLQANRQQKLHAAQAQPEPTREEVPQIQAAQATEGHVASNAVGNEATPSLSEVARNPAASASNDPKKLAEQYVHAVAEMRESPRRKAAYEGSGLDEVDPNVEKVNTARARLLESTAMGDETRREALSQVVQDYENGSFWPGKGYEDSYGGEKASPFAKNEELIPDSWRMAQSDPLRLNSEVNEVQAMQDEASRAFLVRFTEVASQQHVPTQARVESEQAVSFPEQAKDAPTETAPAVEVPPRTRLSLVNFAKTADFIDQTKTDLSARPDVEVKQEIESADSEHQARGLGAIEDSGPRVAALNAYHAREEQHRVTRHLEVPSQTETQRQTYQQ